MAFQLVFKHHLTVFFTTIFKSAVAPECQKKSNDLEKGFVRDGLEASEYFDKFLVSNLFTAKKIIRIFSSYVLCIILTEKAMNGFC